MIADTGASDEAYDGLKPHFNEDEIAWLTTAATLINAWNRIAIASRIEYHPSHTAHAQPVPEVTIG